MGRGSNLLYGKRKAAAKPHPRPRPPVCSGLSEQHLPQDWKYRVHLDYKTEGGGPNGECDCSENDFCRCMRIKEARVEGFNNFSLLAEEVVKDHPHLIADKSTEEAARIVYGIERGLRIADLDLDDFDIGVEAGYYGDEIRGVSLGEENKIKADQVLNELPLQSDTELIHYLLKREHKADYELLKNSKFELQEIKLSEIEPCIASSGASYVKNHRSVAEHVDPWPRAVLKQANIGRYKVIDGAHRIAADRKDGATSAWAYVAK
jgi:hypothetical protein